MGAGHAIARIRLLLVLARFGVACTALYLRERSAAELLAPNSPPVPSERVGKRGEHATATKAKRSGRGVAGRYSEEGDEDEDRGEEDSHGVDVLASPRCSKSLFMAGGLVPPVGAEHCCFRKSDSS